MANDMYIRVEVWPVAADEAGIWLVSGEDALRSSLPVPSDSEPHAETELLLAAGGFEPVVFLHSTSWRADGPSVILTYVAVVDTPGTVLDRWPNARPISLSLARHVGPAPAAPHTAPPAPRYIDVLLHAIRHLRFLLETDEASATAFRPQLRRHLERLAPALAGMYRQTG